MLVNLKKSALSSHSETVCLELTERMPANVQGPCTLVCDFSAKGFNGYYLLTLVVNAELKIICQRCLQPFVHQYSNQTRLAVCESEERARELMDDYECVVADNDHIDLNDLLTDELYLYTPANHSDVNDCDRETSEFISVDQEIM